MEKPLSSEEKLLQLIRKKPEPTAKPADSGEKKSISAITSTEEQTNKDKIATEKPQFNIFGVIDLVLIICSLAIAGYMISKYVLHSTAEEKASVDIKGKDKDEIAARKLALGEAKAIGPYLEQLRERDLFQSPWQQTKTSDTKGATASTGAEALKQFKLVGVVLDKDPKAIIEDSQSKETLFVSKGQSVGSGIVEDISEGKVHIKYNGQIVELVP